MGTKRLLSRARGPALVLIALIFLGTFRVMPPPAIPGVEPVRPPGLYVFDPATGVTLASVTARDGTVTRLAAGRRVPVELPAGFTVFPRSEVVEHVRVERGRDARTVLSMVSDRPLAEIAMYYRAEAEAAGITMAVDMTSDDAITLAGRAANGGRFSLHVTSDGEGAQAQLSVEG